MNKIVVVPQDGIMERLNLMATKLEAMYAAHQKVHYPTSALNPAFYTTFEVRVGGKYAKIMTVEGGKCRSIYCFVDLTNGDILKTASANAPAKGKRGSIWNDNCDVGDDKPCNVHGGGLYRTRI